MERLRHIFKHLVTRDLIVLLMVIGAVTAIYSAVLNGALIWDDSFLVGENPLFRSPKFCLEVFRHYLFVDSWGYYRPVQNLSYIFDYWLWGGTPFGFHLTNLLLHGVSAFLLFVLLKRILPNLLAGQGAEHEAILGQSRGIAFCVVVVWAVHPIHNAAVAYISGRADSLISLFALAAWLLLLRSRVGSTWVQWSLRAIAMVCSLLALCSKEAGLLWMGLFVVWALAFDEAKPAGAKQTGLILGWGRRKMGVVGACLAIILAYSWLHHLAGPRPSVDPSAVDPMPHRVLLMLKAMSEYVGLLFWPAQLHMERRVHLGGTCSSWIALVTNFLHDPKALFGVLAIFILIGCALIKWPGQRLRLFGAIWFLIGFLPISNLIPLNAQAAEHWIYMPSIGLMLFLAGMVLALPRGQSLAVSFVLFATIPLGIRTAYRSQDWTDPQKFFEQTESAGGRSPRTYLNLSNLAMHGGKLELAEKMMRATYKRFPTYSVARINLGINLLSQKDPSKEAEAEQLLSLDTESLKRASKEFAHAWTAPLHLANLRLSQNRPEEALKTLDQARIVFPFPKIWELTAFKAQILQKTQRLDAAINEVQRYVDARWWHFGASMMLGELRAANGEDSAALEAWQNAASLDIHSDQPYVQIARYCVDQKRFLNALEAQKKAVSRAPDKPGNFLLLAAILQELHRETEAKEAFRRAVELRTQSNP